jgi:predicted metalloprotease
MRWSPGGSNPDVEDRRGQRVGGGMGGMRMPMGRMGLGGLVVMIILSLVFKQDFLGLIGGGDAATVTEGPIESTPEEEQLKQFIEFVLGDAQSTWDTTLGQQTGTPYEHARLVLYRDAVQSACGFAQSATGPFYCPGDQKIYIDLGFYAELDQRYGAPGDFAQAYVLAHEIGHHVQYLLGTSSRVRAAQQQNPEAANALSVRLELQADCYAGVWGASAAARDKLEPGDADEGMRAASSVGDDRMQRSAGRAVNPDAFTHGSAAERVAWFRRGLESGSVRSCDTFAAR